jgi:hypothetical protein
MYFLEVYRLERAKSITILGILTAGFVDHTAAAEVDNLRLNPDFG